MTLFGIDRLIADPELRRPLEGKRVALLAHPASVTKDLTHSLDALVATGLNVSAVFGPQHGVRGDLQDNMMESPDFTDPIYGVPVFSRLQAAMDEGQTAKSAVRPANRWGPSIRSSSTSRTSAAESIPT